MTPCTADRKPDFDALVRKGRELIDVGMSAVVYCGSMGDWPLLTDAERQEGVARLVAAGIPTIVGTGAVNSRAAVAHAAHAARVGAHGLMVIPRVLSRGASLVAQEAHFSAILDAAPQLPAVIYNSPYYGFATRADLFFKLRGKHPNLIGFKEFGGAQDMRYAAEFITSQDDEVILMAGSIPRSLMASSIAARRARSPASAMPCPGSVAAGRVEQAGRRGDALARRQAPGFPRPCGCCHRSTRVATWCSITSICWCSTATGNTPCISTRPTR